MPKYWFIGGFVGFAIIAPSSWWIWKTGIFNGNNRPANIFYEDGVSQEEIERIQKLDEIENLG
jgi:hypothetical protein